MLDISVALVTPANQTGTRGERIASTWELGVRRLELDLRWASFLLGGGMGWGGVYQLPTKWWFGAWWFGGQMGWLSKSKIQTPVQTSN